MFYFHHLERVKYKKLIKKLKNVDALEKDEAIIIPIIHPSSEAGKLLLDPGRSASLSELSGENVHILYAKHGQETKFTKFLSSLNEKMDEKLTDPCAVVYISGRKKGLIFNNLRDDKDHDFKEKMHLIIRACISKNPGFALRVLKLKERSIDVATIGLMADLFFNIYELIE